MALGLWGSVLVSEMVHTDNSCFNYKETPKDDKILWIVLCSKHTMFE